MCVHTNVYMHVCIYIYIHIERYTEREREREFAEQVRNLVKQLQKLDHANVLRLHEAGTTNFTVAPVVKASFFAL